MKVELHKWLDNLIAKEQPKPNDNTQEFFFENILRTSDYTSKMVKFSPPEIYLGQD